MDLTELVNCARPILHGYRPRRPDSFLGVPDSHLHDEGLSVHSVQVRQVVLNALEHSVGVEIHKSHARVVVSRKSFSTEASHLQRDFNTGIRYLIRDEITDIVNASEEVGRSLFLLE
ncbi:unnamed protein product [Phytophthora fragariaefolia]|uniref:Unnamed protein product n=1 Tax=Phytophthora fragariaefolia TaxID=1490495 RepID=A0A9W6YGT7_9STRA|nr:unnamed protein product [Phytophthora fragariaefolia]